MKPRISATLLAEYYSCALLAWRRVYDSHKYREEENLFAKTLMEKGVHFEEDVVKKYKAFKVRDKSFDFESAFSETKAHMNRKSSNLYHTILKYEDEEYEYLCEPDLLVLEDNGYHIYEIKYSEKLKTSHIIQLCFNVWVYYQIFQEFPEAYVYLYDHSVVKVQFEDYRAFFFRLIAFLKKDIFENKKKEFYTIKPVCRGCFWERRCFHEEDNRDGFGTIYSLNQKEYSALTGFGLDRRHALIEAGHLAGLSEERSDKSFNRNTSFPKTVIPPEFHQSRMAALYWHARAQKEHCEIVLKRSRKKYSCMIHPVKDYFKTKKTAAVGVVDFVRNVSYVLKNPNGDVFKNFFQDHDPSDVMISGLFERKMLMENYIMPQQISDPEEMVILPDLENFVFSHAALPVSNYFHTTLADFYDHEGPQKYVKMDHVGWYGFLEYLIGIEDEDLFEKVLLKYVKVLSEIYERF